MLPTLTDDLEYNDAPRLIWVRVRDAVERLWVDNPKNHDIGGMARSLQRYGLQAIPVFDPILTPINPDVGAGAIKDGNGRIEALDMLEKGGSTLPRGLATDAEGAWAMPLITGVDAESENLARAYAIDANNLTMMGGDFTPTDMARMWQNKKYIEVLRALGQAGDLPVSVDGDDLDMLLQIGKPLPKTPPARMDEIPALVAKWKPEIGQLWTAGGHKILCGDATSADDHARVMHGQTPLLMMTDPPYGVSVDHSWRDDAKKNSQRTPSSRGGQIKGDTRADWGEVFQLYDPQILYVWHGAAHAAEVWTGMVEAGYQVRQQIIWVKPQLVLSRQAYHWRHEPAWYAVKKGSDANWCGDRKQTTVWEMDSPISPSTADSDKDDADTLHPTQKPVEAYQKAIINHTKRGDLTCDPFLGSGTAVVAAESLNRVCYGVELDPRFIAVTLQRLEDMGLQPELVK